MLFVETTIDGSVIQVTLAKPVLNKQLTPKKKNPFSVVRLYCKTWRGMSCVNL